LYATRRKQQERGDPVISLQITLEMELNLDTVVCVFVGIYALKFAYLVYKDYVGLRMLMKFRQELGLPPRQPRNYDEDAL
jgi:hypothetical protein